MSHRTQSALLCIVIMLMLGGVAIAPARAQPTRPAEAPQVEPRTAEQWLARIEQRADKIDTLKAKVRYDRVKGLLGSEQQRFGTLWYDAGPPVRFAVHFDRLVEDGSPRELNRWYIFDGRWLAEKRVDEKIFVRRQLVPAGRQRDVLQMGGQGPFVLPLDQDKQYVLQRFNVQRMPPQQDDPGHTVHLRLTPKAKQQIDLTRVDLWYDKKTLLPQRAVTVKGEQGAANKSIITLLDVTENPDIDPGQFNTIPPQGEGWQVEVKRLQPQQ